jgi:hypothetical protein
LTPPAPTHPWPSAERIIAESTYAIVGGGGQGTGVAIERDKLLTNCHVIAPNVHKGPLLAISAVTGASTRDHPCRLPDAPKMPASPMLPASTPSR